MDRLTECEELSDPCADVVRDAFGLSDVLVLCAVVVVTLGVWALLRSWPADTNHALPPPPEYAEQLQELQALKSGILWGDLAQTQPWTHSDDAGRAKKPG